MYEPLLTTRLLSLDAFRGITMTLMLLVDVAGDNVPFFSHAKWNGLHLADFVMPSFLFAMGAAVGLRPPGKKKPVVIRVVKLFFLGVLLQGSWLPLGKPNIGLNLTSFRIMGILQRLSIAYLFVCFGKPSIILLLLCAQVAVYMFIKVPGCLYHGDFSIECNAQSWIDRVILGPNHMYHTQYDPEGLVATIGCLLPTLVGVWAVKRQFSLRVYLGGALLVAGALWSFILNEPLNKALWTMSYNLVTTGGCLSFFAILDLVKITRKNILVHLGSNAMLFFVLSDCGGVLSILINSIYVESEGKKYGIVDWFLNFLKVEDNPENIIIFAIVQLFFYFILTSVLFHRKIFFKV